MEPRLYGLPNTRLLTEYSSDPRALVFLGEYLGTPCLVALNPSRYPNATHDTATDLHGYALARARALHPALPRVLAVEHENDVTSIVFAAPEGLPLDAILATESIGISEVYAVVQACAHALASLHAVGIVHWQIRPNTLLLQANGTAMLADFAPYTPKDERAKYVDCIAPELKSSQHRRFADHRTDLFAFGATIRRCILSYECNENLNAHEKALTKALSIIADRLMQPEPADRYATAASLAWDLDQFAFLEHPRNIAQHIGRADGFARNLEIIGRNAERYEILRRWQANDEILPTVVFVAGVALIGKSSLIETVALDFIAHEANIVHIDVDSAPDPYPLTALINGLQRCKQHFVATDTPFDRVLQRSLSTKDRAVLSHFVPRLYQEKFDPANRNEFTLLDLETAIVVAFAAIASALRRLVLIIDPIENLDETTSVILRRIIGACRNQSIFLLFGTSLPRASDVLKEFDSSSENTFWIELAPLGSNDISQIVSRTLGPSPASPAVMALFTKLAGGNPGYATNLCTQTFLRRQISLKDGHIEFNDPISKDFEVDLLGCLDRSKDIVRLTPRALDVLAGVLALGNNSGINQLFGVLDLESSEIALAIAEARQAGFLRQEVGGNYTLSDNRIRESLQRIISVDRLQRLHARIVDLIRREDAELGGPDKTKMLVLADHLSCAGNYADPQDTYDTNALALNYALEQNLESRARKFAIAIVKSLEHKNVVATATYLIDLAELHRRQGENTEAIEALSRALCIVTDPLLRITCIRLRGLTRLATYDFLGAERELELAKSELKKLRPLAWKSRLASLFSNHNPIATDSNGKIEVARLHVFELRLTGWRGRSLNRVARISSNLLRATVELEKHPVRARALSVSAFANTLVGRIDRAYSLYARAIRFARKLDDPGLIGQMLQYAAMGALNVGHFARASRLIHQFRRYSQWIETPEALQVGLAFVIYCCERGFSRQAIQWSNWALGILRERDTKTAIHLPAASIDIFCMAHDETNESTPFAHEAWCKERIKQAPADAHNHYPLMTSLHRYLCKAEPGPDLQPEVNRVLDDLERGSGVISFYCLPVLHLAGRLAIMSLCQPMRQCFNDPIAVLKRCESLLRRRNPNLFYQTVADIFAGHLARRRGKIAVCESLLVRAERYATQHNAPLLHFEVLRCRAHALRAADQPALSLHAARSAQLIARENRANYLELLLMQEFSLQPLHVHIGYDHDWILLIQEGQTQRRRIRALTELNRLIASDAGGTPALASALDSLRELLAAARIGFFAQHSPNSLLVVSPALETGKYSLHHEAIRSTSVRVAKKIHKFTTSGNPTVFVVRIGDGEIASGCLTIEISPHSDYSPTEDDFRLAARHFQLLLSRTRLHDRLDAPAKLLKKEVRPAVLTSPIQMMGSHYRELFESSAEAVLLLDPTSGTVLDLNRRACELSGSHKTLAVGLHHTKIFPPPIRARCEQAFVEALRKGEATLSGEHLIDAQERKIPVELSFRVITNQPRTFVLVHARDQREHERMQERLRHVQKMEAIGRLAGGIAHDFNNMLTVVDRAVDSLEDPQSSTDVREQDVQMIRETVQRASSLTRKLLTFAAQRNPTVKAIDLNHAVTGMHEMIRRILGERLNLVLDLASAPCVIRIDQSDLEQVLLNLAVNAADAMQNGGSLTVRTRLAGKSSPSGEDRVSLEVIDTGNGIDPNVLPKVFEPFFSTKVEGTGLGLATVYGIVTSNRGTIDIESKPGAGTRFSITLPREVAQLSESIASAPPAPLSLVSCKATVLYVEDDENVRSMVSRAIERLGHKVITVSRPEEAIDLVRRQPRRFDLLITDVLMPGMNGPRMAEQMLALAPQLRVLYVSGFAGSDERGSEGGLPRGAMLLRKPFTLAALRQSVNDALAELCKDPTTLPN